MNVSKESMQLYVVSDPTWLHGRTLCDVLEETLQAGATFLQLREKAKTKTELFDLAMEIKTMAKKYNVPFVINDDVETAIAVNCDGAHIGQSDGSVKIARELLKDKILGVSVQSVEQAIAAEADGADYLGVGSMFSTTTKLDADAVDVKTLQAICEAVSIPIVAIGGIHANNIQQLQGSKCNGVAVVSAILASDDIPVATKQLLELSKTYL